MSELLRCRGFFLSEQSTVEGDVLKDVVLLGPVSTNQNEYTDDALKSAVPFFRGRAVYVDHDLKAKARRLDERFGHVDPDSVRYVEQDYDGKPRVRGSIHFLRSHPLAARVVEAVGKGLGYFGVSQVADGIGRKEGKKRIVEQITAVASLDLVDRAATGTLVEQEEPDGDEPMSMDPAQHAQEGLIKMATGILLGEGTPDEKGKKITALLETMEGGTAAATEPPPPPPPMPAEGEGGEAMAEQHRRAWAKWAQALVEQSRKASASAVAPLTAQIQALRVQLVEQANKRPEGKYVKPATTADAPARPAPTQQQPDLSSKDGRKKYLHTP